MSNPSKQKGTAAETAVVRYFTNRGALNVERRAQSGANDRGDIAGVIGAAIEVKACARMELAAWVDEAQTEMVNAEGDIGIVVAKRRGTTDPGNWYAILPVSQLTTLLAESGRLVGRFE